MHALTNNVLLLLLSDCVFFIGLCVYRPPLLDKPPPAGINEKSNKKESRDDTEFTQIEPNTFKEQPEEKLNHIANENKNERVNESQALLEKDSSVDNDHYKNLIDKNKNINNVNSNKAGAVVDHNTVHEKEKSEGKEGDNKKGDIVEDFCSAHHSDEQQKMLRSFSVNSNESECHGAGAKKPIRGRPALERGQSVWSMMSGGQAALAGPATTMTANTVDELNANGKANKIEKPKANSWWSRLTTVLDLSLFR